MIQSIQQGTFGSRLAIPTLLLLPFAVLTHRAGLLNFQMAIALLALCFLVSFAIFICTIVAYIRNSAPEFRANVRTTMFISAVMPLLVIGLIVIGASSGGNVPRIHDISTDTIDVPQFVQGAVERGRDSNSLAVEPDVIRQQLEAYPQIKTHQTALSTEAAFAHAANTAEQLGWEIYNSGPSSGIIEASDTTRLWGFVDDVVIRIQADGEGNKIDLRSVSRVGQGDIGANAARIEKFIALFTQSE